jgi:predicted TIM-barrel fold metal-dependent hydrolase
MRSTLDALRRFNVVKAVISSASLETVGRWKAAAPETVIAAVVHPTAKISVDVLREEYRAGRVSVFGEVIAQLAGLSPSDEIFAPYYALCEELDIPVGIHTGFPPPGAAYRGQPKTRATLGTPLLLEDAILRHPKMRVYIMHGGYPYLDDTIALLHAHPQVYADIAGINWMLPPKEFHEYLRRLV